MFDILTIIVQSVALLGIPLGILGIAGEIKEALRLWKL